MSEKKKFIIQAYKKQEKLYRQHRTTYLDNGNMEDLKNLEFLAVNSKEIIEKQVDSYRQQHSYAGTIIGAIALFIPFFLSGMDGNIQIIQFISIVPIAFFIWSILLLLSIFRTKPLDQAFTVSKYKDLLNKSYKEILLYEIEANARSYNINVIMTEKGNKRYATGVKMATIALLISIVLMMASKFITIEKVPMKVNGVTAVKDNITPLWPWHYGETFFAQQIYAIDAGENSGYKN